VGEGSYEKGINIFKRVLELMPSIHDYLPASRLSMASLMARRWVGFLMTASTEEQSLGGFRERNTSCNV